MKFMYILVLVFTIICRIYYTVFWRLPCQEFRLSLGDTNCSPTVICYESSLIVCTFIFAGVVAGILGVHADLLLFFVPYIRLWTGWNKLSYPTLSTTGCNYLFLNVGKILFCFDYIDTCIYRCLLVGELFGTPVITLLVHTLCFRDREEQSLSVLCKALCRRL